MAEDSRVERLLGAIAGTRAELSSHGMYRQITSLDDLRLFMEHHVFAVWDFMSLLKALQRAVTCQELPWRPMGDPRTRRLVNEIVLEEESDVVDGVATGHFELYLRAMEEIGADTSTISALLDRLERGDDLETALQQAGVPDDDARFVCATFGFIATTKPHVIASAFTFGREDSIPMMFRRITDTVLRHGEQLPTLLTYLERHMQLDEEDHGPKAVEMVRQLCGDDDARWREATDAADEALEARLRLWTSIETALTTNAGKRGEVAAMTVIAAE